MVGVFFVQMLMNVPACMDVTTTAITQTDHIIAHVMLAITLETTIIHVMV